MSGRAENEIHVLHVLNSAHGGSALSTFQLIKELEKRNIKSSLVCYNNAYQDQAEAISQLVDGRVLFIPLYWTNKRIRVKWWKRPILEALTVWQTWWGYKYQKEISDLIRANQINIIHTSTIVNPEGAIAATRNKVPHVWHVRELIGPNRYYRFPRFGSWVRYVEKHAHFLVANSQATARNLAEYFQTPKIICIPNGIDPAGYRLKIHRNTDILIVAMVGNVTSRLKNHEFFIKTAALFRMNSGVSFRIYGALPADTDLYYTRLKNLILQNDMVSKVTFMGHCPSEAIMKDIDVLFHPTGQESFGRIFIEAMAGGIPVLGVDEGGAVELVRTGINGFRIRENDASSAADALKKMVDSVEFRERLGRNGRMIVEKEYSLTLLVNSVLALYEKLACPIEKR